MAIQILGILYREKVLFVLLWQPLVKRPIVTQVINLKADIKWEL